MSPTERDKSALRTRDYRIRRESLVVRRARLAQASTTITGNLSRIDAAIVALDAAQERDGDGTALDLEAAKT